MKVEIDFDILEYFIRQSERVAVIEGIAEHYPNANMDLIKVICGRQLETIPKVKVEESTEDSNREARAKLYEDLLEENYELREESPAESTPPEEHSAQCVGSSSKGKKGIDKGKVMALHNAGWNYPKIADEMGCSVQRVHQIVKETHGDKE